MSSARLKVMEVLECGGPGGTGNQVAALCSGLDPARFEVHLVYAVRPGSTSSDFEATARGAAGFHHIPEMVREISPLKDLKAFWRLRRLFSQERPDIVHAHSSKAGILARAAARAAGVRRIYYSPHGYGFLQTDRSASSRALYRWIERSVSWIGAIVAVSESEAALARELAGPGSVRVVRDAYLGELPSGGLPRKNEGPVSVCASGRLSYARNPEAFVRLARHLATASTPARCLWIGDGELRPEVERLRRVLLLETGLRVTGWLEHGRAVEELTKADIFVHYSRWEGLPNAVLEAMALGLPVVASDIPGNRELVRNGENGFLAADEAGLLRHTLALAKDPELRARLGAAGRALVAGEYTRERMLREMSELYSS